MTNHLHVFEKAGLGRAPFRWLRVEHRVGPVKISERDGVATWCGAPGQPMGCCAYCGQGIAECHVVRSADGREFTLGSDCVHRTDDAGLLQKADKAKREARHQSEDERIEHGHAWAREHARELEAVASPKGRGSFIAYFEWMMVNAGRSGKLRAIREARKLLAASLQVGAGW